MKTYAASLFAVILLAALSLPAAAGDVYNDGPINGEVDAFTINFGSAVSDSFTVSGATSSVNGMAFGAWLFPGDTLQSAEVSISSQPLDSGTIYFDQTVDFTQSGCVANGFGFNVCTETSSFNGPTLNIGTYWLTLQNGAVNLGDPVYWDENSGVGCTSPGCPSEGFNAGVGTIPGEAFTILGSTVGSTTPEPSDIVLLGSGMLVVAGVLRRKISR